MVRMTLSDHEVEPSWRLVGDGLFDWPPTDGLTPTLHGAKCRDCGEIIFPYLADCPLCMQPNVMVAFELRGTGTLKDFVVTHRGPTGFATPYVQGYIKLDDGPTIYSLLDKVEPTETGPKLGERMKMSLGPVTRDGTTDIIGWKFEPDDSGHE
jgi:uncharacterized OB-fold protein